MVMLHLTVLVFKMKKIIALLLTTLVFVSYTHPKDPNRILWSKDRPLTWFDFKAPAKQNQGYDAMTEYSIDYDQVNNRTGVFCYFEKSKSWRIKKQETDYLLKHEQYHFNIAEIYARKLRKQIIELKLMDDQKELKKAYNKIFNECSKAQNNYDKETSHSRNSEAQAKWEKDMDIQMQELNDSSDPFLE